MAVSTKLPDSVITEIESIKSIMIAVATGRAPIETVLTKYSDIKKI